MILIRGLLLVFFFAGQAAGANVQANGAPETQSPQEEVTIEEFLQKLSTVPGVFARRDPFIKSAPPYLALLPREDVQLPTSDLERYDLKDYTITAVLLGDVYNRALIKLPNNKVLIVRERDRLGNRGGVITKINREGVEVQQTYRSNRGVVDKTVVMLPVGGIKQ